MPPQMGAIEPYLDSDTLRCRVFVPKLFVGQIRETLLSGLPVLIELQIQLREEDGQVLTRSIQKYQMRYDIWEDRFTQERGGRINVFSSLDSLSAQWLPVDNLVLQPSGMIDRKTVMTIRAELRVILLTNAQGQQLKNWIFNPSETEEALPTSRRDTGFSLDLTRLVSLFFSRADVIEEFQAAATTVGFTVAGLP